MMACQCENTAHHQKWEGTACSRKRQHHHRPAPNTDHSRCRHPTMRWAELMVLVLDVTFVVGSFLQQCQCQHSLKPFHTQYHLHPLFGYSWIW